MAIDDGKVTKQASSGHKSLCHGNFCCHRGVSGSRKDTHAVVTLREGRECVTTEEATKYPHELCAVIRRAVEAELALMRQR